MLMNHLGALPCLQNAIDEAVEMYQELHMWDECIAVAEARVSFFKTQTRLTAAATPTFVATPPAAFECNHL